MNAGLAAFVCGFELGLDARVITQDHAINQRVRWKRKATDEHFRIGMASPQAPNLNPPVVGWKAHSYGKEDSNNPQ